MKKSDDIHYRLSDKGVLRTLMSGHRGFTIMELMVTVVVVSILAAIAVPSFIDFMVKRRIASLVHEFEGALTYARSEAIKRGTPVVICKSTNGTSCTSSGSWGSGWILFVNTDGDTPPAVDPGEPVLRVFGTLPAGFTMAASTSFANYIAYDRLGMANDLGSFVFCPDNSDETKAGAIDVSRTRPRVAKDTNGDGIPNKINTVTDTIVNITSCENP